MNITQDKVTAYLNSLYVPQNQFLGALRLHCEENHIPLILRDTETLLLQLLHLHKPGRILEIGTAFGYSAIFMATVCENAQITTLELCANSAERARENIKAAGFDHRIQVLLGDGAETLRSLAENTQEREKTLYDFFFLDAAKGHYQLFWDLCCPLFAPKALIVSDNVLFKGMTASDDFLDIRRNKTIMRRMRGYLAYITGLCHVETSVLPVGDGVAISRLTSDR